eukprot:UN03520
MQCMLHPINEKDSPSWKFSHLVQNITINCGQHFTKFMMKSKLHLHIKKQLYKNSPPTDAFPVEKYSTTGKTCALRLRMDDDNFDGKNTRTLTQMLLHLPTGNYPSFPFSSFYKVKFSLKFFFLL